MPRVATLTLNPAIDSACEADAVFPTHKVRTHGERYDPGGGGINVARMLARLGDPVTAVFLAGGVTGMLLDQLIKQPLLEPVRLPIADDTRMSLTVYERSTGQEYRFVPEGPLVSAAEWQAALDHCASLECEYLVASGSLPRGVPDDFLARLATVVTPRGVRLVVDSSGKALTAALDAGGLDVVKPSRGEFEAYVGRSLDTADEVGEAAMALVRAGKARQIAVTLGHQGAVLAHEGGVIVGQAPMIRVISATGAGDSFLAGMVHAMLRGDSTEDAFRFALATGTAAVMSAGTDLARSDDIAKVLDLMAN